MKKFKLTKGFTLIELLVVIAIIGILGAIVYAPFQTARRKGRDAQKIVELKNIQAGLFLYADSHNGYYPKSLSELEAAQTEKLPVNANMTTVYAANKYNYTAYTQTVDLVENVIGFHLFTHLETASPVLAGAAACRGVAALASASSTACIVAADTVVETDSVTDVTPAINFTRAERVGKDNDNNCATDIYSCIYDLKS